MFVAFESIILFIFGNLDGCHIAHNLGIYSTYISRLLVGYLPTQIWWAFLWDEYLEIKLISTQLRIISCVASRDENPPNMIHLMGNLYDTKLYLRHSSYKLNQVQSYLQMAPFKFENKIIFYLFISMLLHHSLKFGQCHAITKFES